jgi:hypothetical protein
MLDVGRVLVQEGAGSRRQAVTLLTKLLAHPDTRIRVLCCLGCARAVQAASADPVRCPCVCREGGPGEERRDRDWHTQSTKRGKECERERERERDRERHEGGREGAKEEEREGGCEGGREGGRVRGREGAREEEREGGCEGGREGGRVRGKKRSDELHPSSE